jgi:DNA-binding NarL/FixJ family response regulator
MTRILIADEHEVVRQGLRKHLGCEPNWEVIVEAADGKEAILKAAETKPDVAVLAYALPLINGIEATAQIRKQLPNTEVVIFTAQKVENLLAYLLKAGARGVVLKSEPVSHLIAAIRTVMARKPYVGDATSPQRALEWPDETDLPLSRRERSVVQLIADGHTNKQIARSLGISLKTVETHRLNVMNKLDLGSAAELVRYAVRNNIVEA